MTSFTIYIVDDEAVARNGLSLALKKKDYIVKGFESAEAVLECNGKYRAGSDTPGHRASRDERR